MKSSKLIILRAAFGEEHLKMLDMSTPSFEALAAGVDAELIQYRVALGVGFWDKIDRLLELCHSRPDGTIILWADSDVLALRIKDPRDLMDPETDIMMRITHKRYQNAGVILMKNSPKLRELLQLAKDKPEKGMEWSDERALNWHLKRAGLVTYKELPREWNQMDPELDQATLAVWHGVDRPTANYQMKFLESKRLAGKFNS